MADVLLGNVLRWLSTRIDARTPRFHSDDELLSLYVSRRDEAAFEAIVRRHGPLVLGVCRRLLFTPQDVEDAFQAVFLILVRKAASLRRRDGLAAWLHGVAHRVAVRARAQAARGGRRHPLDDVPASDPPPDLFRQEARRVLDEEVKRLPDKYRMPVVLCYLQGLTNEAAAQELGCGSATVATRLARARERLRKRLVGRGVEPPVGAFGVSVADFLRPPAVPEACVQAAARAAAVGGAATVVSAPAAALVKGVLREMFWNKAKALAAVTLALGLVVAAGIVGWTALTADTPPRTTTPDKTTDDKASKSTKDDDKAARLWKARGNFSAGNGELAGIAVSPDGATVAVALGINSGASGGLEKTAEAMAVQLWDVEKFKKRATLKDPKRPLTDVVGSLTFSPDGQTLAVSDSMLVLWDTARGKPRCDIPSQGSSLNAVAFSPDGKAVATVAANGVLHVASAETGKLRFEVTAHQVLAVSSAAFADDGNTLLTGDYEGTVKHWDVAKGKLQSSCSLKGKDGAPILMVFSSDGKSAATRTASGAVIQVWDLTTGKPRATLKSRGKSPDPTQLAFSPDGATLVVGSSDGALTVWDLSNEKELTTLKGHKGSIHRLAFSADGKTLASGDAHGRVHVWSLETTKE